MNPYYECHITFEGDPAIGAAGVERNKWKWSRITGDPIMGDGVRQYATMHYSIRKSEDDIWSTMMDIRKNLELEGLIVTRSKIEKVLRDERYDN